MTRRFDFWVWPAVCRQTKGLGWESREETGLCKRHRLAVLEELPERWLSSDWTVSSKVFLLFTAPPVLDRSTFASRSDSKLGRLIDSCFRLAFSPSRASQSSPPNHTVKGFLHFYLISSLLLKGVRVLYLGSCCSWIWSSFCKWLNERAYVCRTISPNRKPSRKIL